MVLGLSLLLFSSFRLWFLGCSQSVLDTLTDVCQEYYHQLLRLLRCAVDAEAYHGGSGFPVSALSCFSVSWCMEDGVCWVGFSDVM